MNPVARYADEGAVSPWAEIVGPCHTTSSLSRVLQIDQVAVADAAAELRALRLRTADGRNLYPAFQVQDDHVHPHLQQVLLVLKSGIDDPWTWAQWLNTEMDSEPSPMSRLWAGDLSGVLRDAEHDAWAWRS
ncbi:hypothetical protein SAMN05216418_1806 [Microbacterium enclense]|uniref:Uncharacterized protein n=1 Tax=Microbacterium enclense TaxID=993073 RepID=A0A1G6JF24_9MICO|nr:hypothetical protein AS029_07735 [Microbacterium enclense]SDC17344.1 hypothetical protein SAMN05216418_1806 [Microbacterium enclense]